MNHNQYKQSIDFLRASLPFSCRTAVVLGSGWSAVSECMENRVEIPYSEIPHFPASTAPAHKSALAAGRVGGVPVIMLCGRFHYYEGYTPEQTAFYVRVLRLIGIENLILTNAAGAINNSYNIGDYMIISDHINLTGISPLRGANDERFGERFPDMTECYDRAFRSYALAAAKMTGIAAHEGIYAYMTGPSYETPAEVRALGMLGADAVGMSTVPEAVCARHAGMRVLGVSCLTNMAAGVTGKPLSEKDVAEVGEKSVLSAQKLIWEIIKEIERI